MAIAVSMQASSSGVLQRRACMIAGFTSTSCCAQRRASCLIQRIDTHTLAEHTIGFEISDNRRRETLGFFLCPFRAADGIEPTIGKTDVLGLEPRTVHALVVDHVAELVKNWVVLGENQRIAELRTKGVPLNRNGIANIFVAHEQRRRNVVALERCLSLA